MTSPRRAVLAVLVALVAAGCAAVRGTVAPSGDPVSRGMWVWSSAEVLGRPASWPDLFEFSRRQGIAALWMQITTARTGADASGPPRLAVTAADAWRAFITAAHRRGLAVEALDGDPTYADAAFHDVPLAIADAVLAFNAASTPGARFDGLHFDNEPYLLPAWHDPAAREQLLHGYLALNDEIQRRVSRARPMTFGVDMPFWWSGTGDGRADADVTVTYEGVRQSAAAHTLRRVDAVTVMDYRNEASGPDGLVALASPFLSDAALARHARVRIGVETQRLRSAAAWFAVGAAGSAARRTLGHTWRERYPGDPFRLHSISDGERLHLGVAMPSAEAGVAPAELVQIARDFGSPLPPDAVTAGADAAALTRTGEWASVRPAPIVDPASGRRYRGFVAVHVPQPKLTFATRPDAFADETAAADRAFRQFSFYRGIAIHDYDGLRALGATRDDAGTARGSALGSPRR